MKNPKKTYLDNRSTFFLHLHPLKFRFGVQPNIVILRVLNGNSETHRGVRQSLLFKLQTVVYMTHKASILPLFMKNFG